MTGMNNKILNIVNKENNMSEVVVSINPTEIKSLEYKNELAVTPGTQIKLSVKAEPKVYLNMSAPLSALVEVSFVAKDEESGKVSFTLETITPLTVSSFVDNLDKVIQANYLSCIMLSVNEKIKQLSSAVGMNIRIPGMTFRYDNN